MSLLDSPELIGLALIVTLVCYRLFFHTPTLTKNGVPLPRPPNTLPLVGNGVLFLQARQKLFSWFVKCERLLGYETFQISVPSLPPGVVINDPKNLEYVFKNEGIFGKGDFFKRRSWALFGGGIITAEGQLWKLQRKAGLSFLNNSNMRVLTDTALPKYLSQSVEFLNEQGEAGRIVDLQSVFHELTSQLMGKMAYDMEMHADDEFTLAFDYASGVTAERFQNPLWFITETFTGHRFRKSLAIVKSFGAKIVQNAVKQSSSHILTNGNELDEVSGTLIHSFLDALGDKEMVADAALNYLSAGRDTIAQNMTWTMMLLMENPSAAESVRKEVQRLLDSMKDSHGTSRSGDSPLDPASCVPSALPYTMAVFYESLRLYPPIPFEIKQCYKATTLPDGTFLPEKSIILWCPLAMGRSKESWGVDADSFRPERWLVDGALATRSASEFPVFNGGARTCLGKKMAESMAAQIISTMVLLFDFMPAYDTQRVSKSSLTLPMEGGLPCHVYTRKHRRP